MNDFRARARCAHAKTQMEWYADNYGSDGYASDGYGREYYDSDYGGPPDYGGRYDLSDSCDSHSACDGSKRHREDLRRDARELHAIGDRAWSGEDSEGEELYSAPHDLDDPETGANYLQPPDEYEEDEGELELLKEEAEMTLEDVARRMVEGAEGVFLTPAAAAQKLGYEEIDATFCMTASGERVPVGGTDLPASLQRTRYSALRAFDTGSPRGWGVCCAQDISSGDVVAEMVGRVLSESEFEQVMRTASPPTPPRMLSLYRDSTAPFSTGRCALCLAAGRHFVRGQLR